MRQIKRRYRRMTMRKSLRPWSPWWQIEPAEVEDYLSKGRW